MKVGKFTKKGFPDLGLMSYSECSENLIRKIIIKKTSQHNFEVLMLRTVVPQVMLKKPYIFEI